jgi:hypothetical protein
MKRLFLPIVFLAFIQLASAQVSDQDVPRTARDQVIPDDLIVQGSECVGLDCVNNEAFGFSTIILKENNLRIKFFDTSTGTFPSNDWTLEANSSANGGTNHFAIVDDDGGRVPFKIIAGAPTNSLFVKGTGDIGIGTDNPVLEVHVADGDSPALRLEQNNSSGFTPQTWDIAGNEANFFVRDVTNGSRLPFKILPGAPTNSLYIKGDGNVGIGTASPAAKLHISSTSASVDELFHVQGAGTVLTRLESSDGGALQFRMKTDNGDNRRFVGEDNSGVVQSQLALRNGGLVDFYATTTATFTRVTAGSTGLTASSSRSLKNNITKLDVPDILDKIAAVPVTTYNWKRELVGDKIAKKKVIGLIAQDFYSVLESGNSNEINGQDVQMALWMGVQALHKKDQNLTDRMEEKDIRIAELEDQVNELNTRLNELSELLRSNQQNILLNSGEKAILGQNSPNPYNQETFIQYYIPLSAKVAEIHFTDISGKLIRKFPIESLGKGQLNLRSNNLPHGNYQYSLIVDGILIDSKKMIITR